MEAEDPRETFLLLKENWEIPMQHFEDLDEKHNFLLNEMLKNSQSKSHILSILAAELSQDPGYQDSAAAQRLKKNLKPLFF